MNGQDRGGEPPSGSDLDKSGGAEGGMPGGSAGGPSGEEAEKPGAPPAKNGEGKKPA